MSGRWRISPRSRSSATAATDSIVWWPNGSGYWNGIPDNPYPQAAIELWPDEPGEAVGAEAIRDVEDRMIALFERIAGARGADVNARDIVVGADASGDAAMWLYALATRLPMGQADRYAVLAAPTVAARLAALSDALDTVSALVEFQLSGD